MQLLQQQDNKYLMSRPEFDNSRTIASEWQDWFNIHLNQEQQVLILDCETTGTSKDDGIIELFIMNLAGEKVYHNYFINTAVINPHAFAVHKLSPKVLKEKGAIRWTQEELTKILSILEGSVIFEWGKGFDKRFVKQMGEQLGIVDADSYGTWHNVMRDFGIYLGELNAKGNQIKDQKLVNAAKLVGFDISEDSAHTAEYDCTMVLAIMRKVVELLEDGSLDI